MLFPVQTKVKCPTVLELLPSSEDCRTEVLLLFSDSDVEVVVRIEDCVESNLHAFDSENESPSLVFPMFSPCVLVFDISLMGFNVISCSSSLDEFVVIVLLE